LTISQWQRVIRPPVQVAGGLQVPPQNNAKPPHV